MVKVVAIVDSRNIRGLSDSLLGFARNPTTQGLDVALAQFGFEATTSFFSVAMPRASDRKHLERQGKTNKEYRDYLLRDARANVLEGSLRRYPNGEMEEKLVDVLCAVECVRQSKLIAEGKSDAEAVLVFSQDIDIKPGIELAIEFNVPVLVASPGAIHNRGVPYMAIAEPPLADLVQADKIEHANGQALRQLLAQAADNPTVDSWEYLYTKRVGKETVAVLRHRHGLEGVADPSILENTERGELHDLGVMGVAQDLPSGFPKALLGLTHHRSEDLLKGTVVGRFNLLSVKVELDSGEQVDADVSNSYLTPGTRVLLQSPRPGAKRPRYIGALDSPPPLVGGGKELGATSVVARIERHIKGSALAVAESAEIEVFLPGAAQKSSIGDRHLVSLVGSGRDATAAFVGHLASTRLP